MQAGNLVGQALVREAETGEPGMDDLLEGHCPAVRGFACKIARALVRREARAAARTCAAIQPRDEAGRFA